MVGTCRLRGKERDVREESSVRDGLDIGGDEVVILISEVDITRSEALEYALDEPDAFVWGTVLDNDLEDDPIGGKYKARSSTHQWLSNRGNGGTVEGVYGDNVNICREMGFEGSFFGCLDGGLASDDGANLCS